VKFGWRKLRNGGYFLIRFRVVLSEATNDVPPEEISCDRAKYRSKI
jgi:hypothetical protein